MRELSRNPLFRLMKTIFKNLQVLELANVLAGPATGMFFAELGARVIKVENKTTGGDLTRNWKLPEEEAGTRLSAYYASVNYGKEVILLNVMEEIDRQKVYSLVSKSDIVISNYRKGEAEKLGMTFAKFKELKPDIIQGNLTSYGEEDPRAGFDLVLQAEAGFMSMNGNAASGPLKMPVALIDVLAAHQLKEALLLALIRKGQSGEGGYVSVSLMDTAISSLVNQASNYLNLSYVPGLSGSFHPNIAPYGEIIQGSDGRTIVLAVGNDKQFKALCRVLGEPDLAIRSTYATNKQRLLNRLELGIELNRAALKMKSDTLLSQLQENQVPAGLIRTLREVFDSSDGAEMVLHEIKEGHPFRSVSSLSFKGIA
jgi:crotonobetainyl-CoA:carnitine CoA-transferase CaiB-like acyl-CoA transferase